WNLVANPYAAAIDAEAFIAENDNTTGSIYIWDDYGSNVERGTNDDYIVINLIGATETDSRAGNLSRYNDHIGSAQGFFVQLSGSGGNDITFTESMRESGNNSDDNFFRNGTIETVRLNLSNEEGLFRQTLIGWVDDISDDEITPGYDAIRFNSSKTSLYSIKDSKDLSIQGVSDLKTNIQLGIELENEGIYQINLDDNNYNGPSLLLYDNELEVIHHFNAGPYEFTAGADMSPTRFVLINSSSATLSADAKDWTVYAHDNIIHIKPNSKESRLYQLYTLTGQFVRKQKVTEQTQIDINGLTNGVYIIFDGFSSTKIVKN
ncbi:MAG: T9SS type A sorting domain-containing protein, partial [Marinoscillum sp.]